MPDEPGRAGLLRRLLPRSRRGRLLLAGAAVAALVLVVAFTAPLVSLLAQLVEVAASLLRPLLDDPGGRLVLVCASLVLGVLLALHLLRHRIRSFRAGLVLRRHLDGVAEFLADDRRRARTLLERVARASGPLPPELRWAPHDAQLKLARLALLDGDADAALAWCLRCAQGDEAHALPEPLRRARTHLRIEAMVGSGAALPEAVAREVEVALAEFPDDVVLLRRWRQACVGRGASDQAAAAQERIAALAPPAERAREQVRLVDDLVANGRHGLAAGDLDLAEREAQRALAHAPAAAAPRLLLGDVRMARGDLRGALRAWAEVPGAAGLGRIHEALQAADGEPLTPREVIECCPTEGGLLVAALLHSRRGEHRRARRAARHAVASLGTTPSAVAVLVEVLHRAGDPDAERIAHEVAARVSF